MLSLARVKKLEQKARRAKRLRYRQFGEAIMRKYQVAKSDTGLVPKILDKSSKSNRNTRQINDLKEFNECFKIVPKKASSKPDSIKLDDNHNKPADQDQPEQDQSLVQHHNNHDHVQLNKGNQFKSNKLDGRGNRANQVQRNQDVNHAPVQHHNQGYNHLNKNSQIKSKLH